MFFNVSEIFDGLTEISNLEQDCVSLLEKVVNIKTPMKFLNNFATDEQLDQLEIYLDNKIIGNVEVEFFKNIINDLPPVLNQGFVFI